MFQRPRGTRDFGPREMAVRRWAMERMRAEAVKRGFSEVQMPIFEELELFTRKSGQEIVEELYAFKDKGGRDIALRPEMTAQVMRFYVSDLAVLPKPLKLFYFGPCFRYENPQSGRFREFYQFGAEVVGARTPETDAEIVSLAASMIESVALENFRVRVGYIGILRKILRKSALTEEKISAALHLLDKNEVDRFREYATVNGLSQEAIDGMMRIRNLRGGSDILDQIEDDDARQYLSELWGCLVSLGVKNCELDLGIVRGLDYYTGMVFEIDAPSLGAEKQICGGGSYDLVPLFGGEQIFTTGFAIGFDRVLIAIENEREVPVGRPLEVYVVPVGKAALDKAMALVRELREAGIAADFDLMRRTLSKNLKYAAAVNVKKVVIIGDREIAEGVATVRDMDSGEQLTVRLEDIVDHMTG